MLLYGVQLKYELGFISFMGNELGGTAPLSLVVWNGRKGVHGVRRQKTHQSGFRRLQPPENDKISQKETSWKRITHSMDAQWEKETWKGEKTGKVSMLARYGMT